MRLCRDEHLSGLLDHAEQRAQRDAIVCHQALIAQIDFGRCPQLLHGQCDLAQRELLQQAQLVKLAQALVPQVEREVANDVYTDEEWSAYCKFEKSVQVRKRWCSCRVEPCLGAVPILILH